MLKGAAETKGSEEKHLKRYQQENQWEKITFFA